MKLDLIINKINSKFMSQENEHYNEQCGLMFNASNEVKKIGYASNLTLEVIEKANEMEVHLIVTHHDAWTFIGNLNERCHELLKKYGISHYYNHLPLDDAKFGTNYSLARVLGLNVLKQVNEEEGFIFNW